MTDQHLATIARLRKQLARAHQEIALLKGGARPLEPYRVVRYRMAQAALERIAESKRDPWASAIAASVLKKMNAPGRRKRTAGE